MAKRVKMVRPDRTEIKLPDDGVELLEDKSSKDLGFLQSNEEKEVLWKIKATGKGEIKVEISIHSTRGGIDRKEIKIPSVD